MPDVSKINETIEEDLINGIRELLEGMDRHFEEMHNEITQMTADYKNEITKFEESVKAHDKKLIEELEAHNEKLISESEARIKASILQMEERLKAFDQSRKDHQNRITQVKSDNKNNDIANQHTNVKIDRRNPIAPQSTHIKWRDSKQEAYLHEIQEKAFHVIESLIRGNKNASTGIISMNNFLDDYHNYSNGKKLTTVDLLNTLKERAKERTSGFFSLPSFSSFSSFFSSFMSFGRKEWVNDLYTALNNMGNPNELEDVEKLLSKLEHIKPDNSANIAEKNKKKGSEGYKSFQNTSLSKKT
jgi:hypothetical protein